TISDFQTGKAAFTLTIHYSAAMRTTIAPVIVLAPAVGATLTFAAGSWDGTHTTYLASYNVTDAGAHVPSVTVAVRGARNAAGNLQIAKAPSATFAIDMGHPTVI